VSVLTGLFDDLDRMSLLQLLLVFGACISTAFTLGALLSARARLFAGAMALGCTAAFIVSSDSWPNAVMLAAIAVAGLGLFTAAVWVITRLAGLEPHGRRAATPPDSSLPSEEPTAAQPAPIGRQGREQLPST
jgi:hypothetical protein